MWFVVLFVANAVAAMPLQACMDEAETQLQMTGCAADEYTRQDAELNARWQVIKARMASAQFKLLTKEQVAWIRRKEAACARPSGGGSMAPMNQNLCLAKETSSRNAVLRTVMRRVGAKLARSQCCSIWGGKWNGSSHVSRQCTYWTYALDMDEWRAVWSGYKQCLDDPSAPLGCISGNGKVDCN